MAAAQAGPIARVDLEIAKAAAPLADLPPVKALAKLSELADQPPLIAASLAVAIAGLGVRNPRLVRTGIRMLASHALATAIKTVIKDNIDRTRPEKVCEDGEHEAQQGTQKDGDYRSLPSGHTAGAVAVARAIVREYEGAAPAAYGLASIAAVSQIPKKAHFPSDVVVGLAIGLVSEAVIHALARRWVQKD